MDRAKESRLSAESEVERLRKRLSRMTDAELLRFVDAARVLCEGKNPSKSYTVQLKEARAEWVRRQQK
jgi:hypothetical protein